MGILRLFFWIGMTASLSYEAQASFHDYPQSVLVDTAALIATGEVTRLQSTEILFQGRPAEIVLFKVKRVFKSSAPSTPGEIRVIQPDKPYSSTSLRIPVGWQGALFLKPVNAEASLFYADHPGHYIVGEDLGAGLEKVIRARKLAPSGLPVEGLVARLEYAERDSFSTSEVVHLSLNNISTEKIALCKVRLENTSNRILSPLLFSPEGKLKQALNIFGAPYPSNETLLHPGQSLYLGLSLKRSGVILITSRTEHGGARGVYSVDELGNGAILFEIALKPDHCLSQSTARWFGTLRSNAIGIPRS